jgi:DNA modification methylase
MKLFITEDEAKEKEVEGLDDLVIVPNDLKEVRKGDVWSLGGHRLMCGDSLSREDVERLMGGEKADLVFTDPPYGMGKEKDGVLNDNQNADELLEFNRQWIVLSLDSLSEVGSWYCWGTDEGLMDIYAFVMRPLAKSGKVTFRNLLTWDKGSALGQNSHDMRLYPKADEKCLFFMKGVQGFNTNSDHYFEGWEPIRSYLVGEAAKIGVVGNASLQKITGCGSMWSHWFTKSQFCLITEKHYNELREFAKGNAFKKDYDAIKKDYDAIKKEYYSTRSYFDNFENMNDVFHDKRARYTDYSSGDGNILHATPKPLSICRRCIRASSPEGALVLDLFGGSGSTLIACETLGRRCRMMELDPHFCAIIIQRWEKATGKKAQKEVK